MVVNGKAGGGYGCAWLHSRSIYIYPRVTKTGSDRKTCLGWYHCSVHIRATTNDKIIHFDPDPPASDYLGVHPRHSIGKSCVNTKSYL